VNPLAVYELKGVRPVLGRDVFIADSASVIGEVYLGDEASVWFGAVLRGDYFSIRVGARSNIQDNAVVHITNGTAKTTIGEDVVVGHGAIIHGATIGNRSLIGMGSIVLDNAIVGDDSLVAAGALVTPNTVIPPRRVAMGRPARVVREVTEADLEFIRKGAANYLRYAREFRGACKRVPDA